MKNQSIFLITGLISGLICVAPGVSWLMLLTLTWGVGPALFAAVVAGILITGARRHLQAGFLRYITGLAVCFITYLLALTVFFAVAGFSPDWFGFRPSDLVNHEFGIDVVLGLLAAATFAAGGIALFAFVLTGWWSNLLWARLLLAGIGTIVFTSIVNYQFRSYWSFYGVLVPLGNSLFCWAVGRYLWQQSESERETGATARTPHQRPA